MKVEPYLFFEGRADEAIEFYKKALGAQVTMLMRYKDSPDKSHMPKGADDKVMHCSMRIGDTTVMASDGMASGKASFDGVSLSISAKDGAEAERLFAALAEGGQVQMPIGKTFWAERFGMLADRFGVRWMIGTEG